MNSENYIDATTVTLKGESLQQTVEKGVQSDEFASFRTEERLREMNESKEGKDGLSGPILSKTYGTYTVPVEYVRYVAAILAADAPPRASPLTALISKVRGTVDRLTGRASRNGVGIATPAPSPRSRRTRAVARGVRARAKTIVYNRCPTL